MNNLTTYLTNNLIQFKQISDVTVEINNQTFQLIKPNEENKLFEAGLELICEETTEDNYIFELADQYYWTPKGTEGEAKLNPIKYIGQSTSKIPIPFLGVHGRHEILNCSASYSDWVKKAKFLGVKTLGICEKNTLSGTLSFQKACKKEGIKPIIGASYVIYDEEKDIRYILKFYIQNKEGWQNILLFEKEANVINIGYVRKSILTPETLKGLFTIADPKSTPFGEFKADYFQLDSVEYDKNERDKEYLQNLKKYVGSDIPPIAIYDAYYLDEDESHIKSILNKIGKFKEYASKNQYFKPFETYFKEIKGLYPKGDKRLSETIKNAINNVNYVSSECIFNIETGKRHLPQYKMTDEEIEQFGTRAKLFSHLIQEGLNKKNIPKEKLSTYIDRVKTELEVINYGNVRDYFLINWDQNKWCSQNGILTGESRGSAAGSLIAYLLNITKIDPIEYNLLFERFLTKGRVARTIKSERIIVKQGDETLEFWEDDEIKVLIDGKEKYILAKNLTENCEILWGQISTK